MLKSLAGAIQTRLIVYLILAVGVLFLWESIIQTAVEDNRYQRQQKFDQIARENEQRRQNAVQLQEDLRRATAKLVDAGR